MKQKIHLGLSTCPNDTFAFAGLLTGTVPSRSIEFQFELLDIEQLNERLGRGDFDVAKTSFGAATQWTDRCILPVGSALGFGVGPLLLSRPDAPPIDDPETVILCPGQRTTASRLLNWFYPLVGEVQQVVFSEIMPRLQDQTADYGVCIHEGRFTWQAAGLRMVADLGDVWQRETKLPLPLGGLVASRKLSDDTLTAVCACIDESLAAAHRSPQSAIPTMRQYAQEFDDAVLMRHVELYVNDRTTNLGIIGESALVEFWKRSGVTNPPIFFRR